MKKILSIVLSLCLCFGMIPMILSGAADVEIQDMPRSNHNITELTYYDKTPDPNAQGEMANYPAVWMHYEDPDGHTNTEVFTLKEVGSEEEAENTKFGIKGLRISGKWYKVVGLWTVNPETDIIDKGNGEKALFTPLYYSEGDKPETGDTVQLAIFDYESGGISNLVDVVIPGSGEQFETEVDTDDKNDTDEQTDSDDSTDSGNTTDSDEPTDTDEQTDIAKSCLHEHIHYEFTDYKHWAICDDCNETVVYSESHSYEYKFDDENHWLECFCGKKTDPSPHRKVYNGDTKSGEVEVTCMDCAWKGTEYLADPKKPENVKVKLNSLETGKMVNMHGSIYNCAIAKLDVEFSTQEGIPQYFVSPMHEDTLKVNAGTSPHFQVEENNEVTTISQGQRVTKGPNGETFEVTENGTFKVTNLSVPVFTEQPDDPSEGYTKGTDANIIIGVAADNKAKMSELEVVKVPIDDSSVGKTFPETKCPHEHTHFEYDNETHWLVCDECGEKNNRKHCHAFP